MALSTTAKAGIGGLGTISIGGPAATYLAWDHITLYAVEREVIRENVKFKVEQTTNNNQSITVSIEDSSKSKLPSGYGWSCVISAGKDISSSTTNLAKYIKSHLQADTENPTEKQKYNKKLLVKACAKQHQENKETKTVTGSLTLKSDSQDTNRFTFENIPDLDFLLENALYEVEEEVLKKDVKFTISSDSNSKKITIKAPVNVATSQESNKLIHNHSWVCEISFSSVDTFPDGLDTKLKNKLPEGTKTIDDSQKTNKSLLVKACSKNRQNTPSNTSVTGQLIVTKSSNTYSFTNHSELNTLLNS